ncbi:MAG: ribonuclease III [Gammaproteobacteria bacterium]|nr:ribonuclease III [Gammaproteobacteria bacterium]
MNDFSAQRAAARVHRALGYEFRDATLLWHALTHRSFGTPHNERLEFLGDALLGMVVAEYLFNRFPEADEGRLTRTRATLVNRESLAELARDLELGEHLRLGEGELKSGGWRRDSILANALEALLGAIYLDGGMDACRDTVLRVLEPRLAAIDPTTSTKDAKTALQEYLQGRRLSLPEYTTMDISGPSHAQLFTVSCTVGVLPEPVIASGPSRRKAEQAAARAALTALTQR